LDTYVAVRKAESARGDTSLKMYQYMYTLEAPVCYRCRNIVDFSQVHRYSSGFGRVSCWHGWECNQIPSFARVRCRERTSSVGYCTYVWGLLRSFCELGRDTWNGCLNARLGIFTE
jgi:hypothetical protein